MLELRPTCESCDRALPPDAVDALICTFECTWCADCAATFPDRACPNCGGNLERRPIRPAHLLADNPPALPSAGVPPTAAPSQVADVAELRHRAD